MHPDIYREYAQINTSQSFYIKEDKGKLGEENENGRRNEAARRNGICDRWKEGTGNLGWPISQCCYCGPYGFLWKLMLKEDYRIRHNFMMLIGQWFICLSSSSEWDERNEGSVKLS